MAAQSIAFILASASPARLTTLRAAGLAPQVVVSGVDEDAVLAAEPSLTPVDAVLALARAKAEQVIRNVPEQNGTEGSKLVLGCDSMLELDGVLHGKPASADEARERWRHLRGNTGVLHSGHWLIRRDADGNEQSCGETASTRVHFAQISDEEIDAYVATGEPLAVAGAFTIDGLGAAFITGVEGDHHAVIGVSVPLLRDLSGQLGVFWPDLWQNGVAAFV